MILRLYKSEDCKEIAKLFYETVHTVCEKDYSKEQLQVWATGNIDLESWDKSFLENTTIIAEINNMIVGFGDIDSSGYLDRLYVHSDYQRQGIATIIVDRLEQSAKIITTYASITAKSFFENRGYHVISENMVSCQEIKLKNYIMRKYI